ncbi:MAG TPA: transglutaminase-like domain-containing protein [Pseudonocardia sp.]|nr:transglutaminase-like domain-containing protein [Pseudonocardia sp.]
MGEPGTGRAVRRFTALARLPAPPLDRAAIALAAGADPDLDPAGPLAELDRLAEGVDSLAGLVRRLFHEEGFAGNTADYYDPRNSLLPHVLERRTGIPISLAVVTIEVGRRAGVTLEPVGMPGHFLVREPGADRHLDVFGGGRLLDRSGCEQLFRGATGAGREVPFGAHLLAPASTRGVLTRMLENLRGIYRARRRPADLEWVLRMRLALPGAGPAELIELGTALGEQGRWLDGARLLEAHAAVAPESPPEVEQLRTAARSLRAHLN